MTTVHYGSGIGRPAEGTMAFDVKAVKINDKTNLILEFSQRNLSSMFTMEDLTKSDIEELIDALKYVKGSFK